MKAEQCHFASGDRASQGEVKSNLGLLHCQVCYFYSTFWASLGKPVILWTPGQPTLSFLNMGHRAYGVIFGGIFFMLLHNFSVEAGFCT